MPLPPRPTPDQQCTAHCKHTKLRCKQWAVTGKTVCRMHGGKSRAGIASPAFKDGRYSKYLPARMLERFNQSVDDPELLSLRRDIALLDARLEDIMQRVDTNESGAIWRELATVNSDIQTAIRIDNATLLQTSLRTLHELITKGRGDYAAWREIGTIIEQRRKLIEAEQKRLVAGQQIITNEEAMTFYAALIAAVQARVTNEKQLSEIQAEFIRIAGLDDSRQSRNARSLTSGRTSGGGSGQVD